MMDSKALPFVTASKREIFYEFHSQGNETPIIFLNGLSDSYSEWKTVVELTSIKRSCLFVDLIGQGQSIEKEFSSGKKFDYRISIEEQGQSLLELCRFLKISEFNLVGFSYGGGLALWVAQNSPERVQKLILFLPFLLRLDLAFPLSRILHFQYDLIKKMTPAFLQAPYHLIEKSYEHFVHDYMHFRFSERIPQPLYREAAIQISEGIMKFNVFRVLNNLPPSKLHLVSADLDTLIPKSLVREFWTRLPESKKQSWTRIEDGEHLLFDQNPVFCAALLESLLNMPELETPLERKISTQDSRVSSANLFSAS